jgi:uncharacterized protein (TIGR02231 family)
MEESIAYRLTDVTVYPDRAQVTCRGNVNLSPEVGTLIFDGLPLSMEKESVRVSGAGGVAVRLLSVDIVQEHYEQSPSPVFQKLEAEIEVVSEELLAVEDESAIWQAEADQLNGLRQATGEYAKGLSRGRMSVEDQKDLMAFIRAQDRSIKNEQRDLDSQARLLKRRLEKLQKDLSELRSSQPRSRYQVRVNVEVEGEGEFSPVLTYVVGNAHWRPLYDIQYHDSQESGKELSISTFAQVSQNTGQDWHDVQLKVSTARPALNQRIPDLKPWYIDSYMPPPAPVAREKRLGVALSHQAVMADADYDLSGEMVGGMEMMEAQIVNAAVQNENAIVNFKVAGSCTVESDNSPHKFLLAQFFPKTSLTYLAVPKHTDAVFRMIKMLNEGAAPLLDGQGSLFFNDEYIGKTHFDYTPVKGELELLLGVEERIEVKRELVKRSVDKKLLKDHRVINYGYEIEIKNLLESMSDLELRDQLPVSRHEEIQVKLDQAEPKPSERSELNILEWQMQLDPKSETVVKFSYTVQYPRSMRISGLQD